MAAVLQSTGTVLTAGNGTSAALAIGGTAAAGDILVAVIYSESGGTWTAPDGTWTNKADLSANVPANRGRILVFWKRCTGGESGTVTFTCSTNAWRLGAILRVSGGLSSGDPFNATASNEPASGTSTAISITGFSPTASGLMVWAAENWTGGGSWTPPSGMTEQVDSDTLEVATEAGVPSGSVGTLTGTYTAAGPEKAWVGQLADGGGGSAASGTASLSLSASGGGAAAAAAGGSLTLSGSAVWSQLAAAALTLLGSAIASEPASGAIALSGSAVVSEPAAGAIALSGSATWSEPAAGAMSLLAAGAAAARAAGTSSATLFGTGNTGGSTPASGAAALTLTSTATGAATATGTGSLALAATGTARAALAGAGALALAAAGAARAAITAAANLTLTALGNIAARVTGGTGQLELVGVITMPGKTGEVDAAASVADARWTATVAGVGTASIVPDTRQAALVAATRAATIAPPTWEAETA